MNYEFGNEGTVLDKVTCEKILPNNYGFKSIYSGISPLSYNAVENCLFTSTIILGSIIIVYLK